MHRTGLTAENYLAQNGNSAEVEKPTLETLGHLRRKIWDTMALALPH